jgi:hypothetical protein
VVTATGGDLEAACVVEGEGMEGNNSPREAPELQSGAVAAAAAAVAAAAAMGAVVVETE